MSIAASNAAAGVYSFLDVMASITYAGVTNTLTASANAGSLGFSEEGIKVTRTVEKNVMTVGADGAVMHSLRAGRQGRITFSLLKTSPGNAILNDLYNTQSVQSARWGRNLITINNLNTGDNITAAFCAFVKQPDNLNRGEGGVMDWEFDAGFIDEVLGNGGQPTGIQNPG